MIDEVREELLAAYLYSALKSVQHRADWNSPPHVKHMCMNMPTHRWYVHRLEDLWGQTPAQS